MHHESCRLSCITSHAASHASRAAAPSPSRRWRRAAAPARSPSPRRTRRLSAGRSWRVRGAPPRPRSPSCWCAPSNPWSHLPNTSAPPWEPSAYRMGAPTASEPSAPRLGSRGGATCVAQVAESPHFWCHARAALLWRPRAAPPGVPPPPLVAVAGLADGTLLCFDPSDSCPPAAAAAGGGGRAAGRAEMRQLLRLRVGESALSLAPRRGGRAAGGAAAGVEGAAGAAGWELYVHSNRGALLAWDAVRGALALTRLVGADDWGEASPSHPWSHLPGAAQPRACPRPRPRPRPRTHLRARTPAPGRRAGCAACVHARAMPDHLAWVAGGDRALGFGRARPQGRGMHGRSAPLGETVSPQPPRTAAGPPHARGRARTKPRVTPSTAALGAGSVHGTPRGAALPPPAHRRAALRAPPARLRPGHGAASPPGHSAGGRGARGRMAPRAVNAALSR
jgi:hypothetical protein